MKFVAIMALFGAVQSYKLGYEESEGPTKTDNGENDDWVTKREQDVKNGEKESGWTIPLGWADEGDDDDTVITQLDSEINMSSEHRAKHHHHNKHSKHHKVNSNLEMSMMEITTLSAHTMLWKSTKNLTGALLRVFTVTTTQTNGKNNISDTIEI